MKTLIKDPLNLIIAGVGGQGNLVLSQLIGNILMKDGYFVLCGETLGGTQRGGSVMSHVRISREAIYGPLIPIGGADIILSLEPHEALRALIQLGNPHVITITASRPIYSIGADYPSLSKVIKIIRELSAKSWIIDATSEALKLGGAIFSNTIMLGALIACGALPLEKKPIEVALGETFPKAIDTNLIALSKGMDLIKR